MTKKQESTALATVEPNDDLVVAGGYDAGDVRGKEGIEQDDLVLSRLAIAQKMSPEVDEENEAKFVEGLKIGHLFDTVTHENYGPGPLKFTIVRPVDKSAKVLDKEGNVLEWDVDFNDPRCEFTNGEGQTRVPPVATRFYNFLVLLNDNPSFPVVLSMKRTQVPIAKNLMTLMARRPGPIFAGSYTVRTVTQEGPNGPFKNFAINPAGAAPDNVRQLAEGWYTKLQTASYRVEQGPETRTTDEPPF